MTAFVGGRQLGVGDADQPVVDAAKPGGLAEDVQHFERVVVEPRGLATVDFDARPGLEGVRGRARCWPC